MAFLEQEIHEEPKTFISKYVFSFDHKIIAKQFLWYGIFFLGVGGMMALVIRWTLAFPGQPFPLIGQFLFPDSGGVCPPDTYASILDRSRFRAFIISFFIYSFRWSSWWVDIIPNLINSDRESRSRTKPLGFISLGSWYFIYDGCS